MEEEAGRGFGCPGGAESRGRARAPALYVRREAARRGEDAAKAAGVSSPPRAPDFFRDGAGCGACYQLRCRDRRVCGDGGVKVVVTDAANRTGFLLASREAFAAMAKDGMADQLQLLAGGGSDNVVVPVDFRR